MTRRSIRHTKIIKQGRITAECYCRDNRLDIALMTEIPE